MGLRLGRVKENYMIAQKKVNKKRAEEYNIYLIL